MNRWEGVRTHAREHRANLLHGEESPITANLLMRAAVASEIVAIPLPPGDALLYGAQGVYDPEMGMIWYDASLPDDMKHFVLAHEYAHHWLGHGAVIDAAEDLAPDMAEEPGALQRVDGYSQFDLVERSANVFAREFLLPPDALISWFSDRTWGNERLPDVPALARYLAVPESLVYYQFTHALLQETVGPSADAAVARIDSVSLDPGQLEAATWRQGPLLVEAGPGTGKTRTLVHRVTWLLAGGVRPESILALTFSNRAAMEMRERVAQVAPDTAPKIWMGTFHAFGLEILRKWGGENGIPPTFTVLDPVDAFLLLEQELPRLDLRYYQNLYDPTLYLDDLLGAISRAKDELVAPEQYAELAGAMRDAATSPEAVEAAEKALEVARVYTVYQEALTRAGAVDFGDLIMRTVTLLQRAPHVRATLRATYRHILVDEYQDVNRASALLLKEIAGEGDGLWVVGDARQAIYRFRGAAPTNMRHFADDFPTATTVTLGRNYRSQPAVVDVVAAFAPGMRATQGQVFVPWQAYRPALDGSVHLEIAEDDVSESVGIARVIRALQSSGVPFGEQAILARSHTTLVRIAMELERADVPILYLGDLFERPEIRDLLALVSLMVDPRGYGLVRVAHLTEYGIPHADVRRILAAARAESVAFPHALAWAVENVDLSPRGRAGLARLAEHLDGIRGDRTAWQMLMHYLFSVSDYLRPLLDDGERSQRPERLAIYQFLRVAHDFQSRAVRPEGDPKQAFLRYVRRLAATGADRQLSQVPEWAAGIDAVRLLTVHASKGLEFRAVYLPGLGQGYFPSRKQRSPCPPPVGMIERIAGTNPEAEEEECLFFVALSRARDHLHLSRAKRYGKQNSNPSSLLLMIDDALPGAADRPVTWPASVTPDAAPGHGTPLIPKERPSYTAQMLELYRDCPKKFAYEYVMGLSGRDETSAYVQFHQCVYAVLRWLGEQHRSGVTVDVTAALAQLATIWETQGPIDHAYAAVYRSQAEMMIRTTLGHPLWRRGRGGDDWWEVPLDHGRVCFRPDIVVPPEESANGNPIIQRLRTGRPTVAEEEQDIYALYQIAALRRFPGTTPQVEVAYLAHDTVTPIALSDRKIKTRLKHYDDALVGILQSQFPAAPNDRICPRCPYYFICPAAEDVR